MGMLPNFMGSGILGLGKRESIEPTFVEMLWKAGGIGRAEFSLFLSSSICSN
jgi:hypothetical protein